MGVSHAGEWGGQLRSPKNERRRREIRQRAERKCGEALKGMKETGELHSAGRPQKSSGHARITDILSYDQSSDWQRVADLPEEEFEAELAQGTSTSTMAQIARNKERPLESLVTPVSDDALWLWGRLCDFEREGVLEKDPNTFMPTMMDHMRETTPQERMIRLSGSTNN
jgi:hypothetical protein